MAPRRRAHPVGKRLDVLRVHCPKCAREGRYRVAKLAETIGWDAKLTDWLDGLTRDCPSKLKPATAIRAGRAAQACPRSV